MRPCGRKDVIFFYSWDNLGGKSADSASVEDASPLLQLRLDLPATLLFCRIKSEKTSFSAIFFLKLLAFFENRYILSKVERHDVRS